MWETDSDGGRRVLRIRIEGDRAREARSVKKKKILGADFLFHPSFFFPFHTPPSIGLWH